jgi:hypothetical protein
MHRFYSPTGKRADAGCQGAERKPKKDDDLVAFTEFHTRESNDPGGVRASRPSKEKRQSADEDNGNIRCPNRGHGAATIARSGCASSASNWSWIASGSAKRRKRSFGLGQVKTRTAFARVTGRRRSRDVAGLHVDQGAYSWLSQIIHCNTWPVRSDFRSKLACSACQFNGLPDTRGSARKGGNDFLWTGCIQVLSCFSSRISRAKSK